MTSLTGERVPRGSGRWLAADGAWETILRGRYVLADPRINRGAAFNDAERAELGLVGLLPPRILTLDEQAARAYEQYHSQPTNLAKHVWLTLLQDRNEVLFYRVLSDHLREMLPVVYTPTVGEAIERYSHEYRRPRGVFLSVNQPEAIETSLLATGLGADDVDLVVATDAEAILGIGDWGVGGIGIAIGKLTVYTAAAGIDPGRVIPVMLDVGTNRDSLLEDPLYLGNRHRRVGQDQYDAFVDAFVHVVTRVFPNALLHWEDIGTENARRLLDRYRDDICTFNDDMQGTGAVNLAALLAAVRATGTRLRDHRVVVFGAGTAGLGIADQLHDAMVGDGLASSDASARIWLVDRYGLVTEGTPGVRPSQRRYARPTAEVDGWARAAEGVDGYQAIGLGEVVARVHPTLLIGTSGQTGAFTHEVVAAMAGHCERPVILPMSNPTPLAEATPSDLIAWTDGRALVATGSPFPSVTYKGVSYVIAQANNALVFPGLGLGTVMARAARVTDKMLSAAATAVAASASVGTPGSSILPQVEDLRPTSAAVAAAVARAASDAGVARAELPDDLEAAAWARMWQPEYRPIRAV